MHVVAKHRLSIATYCRTWSLPPDTKLISPMLIKKRASKDDPWLAKNGGQLCEHPVYRSSPRLGV
jgi:hypothetical protein